MEPVYDVLSLERLRREQIIQVFSVYILVFLSAFLVIDVVLKRYHVAGILALILILIAVNFALFQRTKEAGRAATFIILTYIVLSISMFYEGGIEKSGIVWSYFVPIFAFYLLGARDGLKWTVSHLALTLVVYILSLTPLFPLVYKPLYFLIFYTSLLAASTFLMIFEKVRQQYAESAREASRKLIEVNEELQLLSSRDFLTGIRNRREISSILSREIHRSSRYNTPLSILMLDLDHFKQLNDSFGHATGDAALRETSLKMEKLLRTSDSLGRFGGEEFLIVLPNTDRIAGGLVAERIRTGIESIRLENSQPENISVTASIGLSELHPHDNLELLIQRADRALYKAKENGRNCVYSTEAPTPA